MPEKGFYYHYKRDPAGPFNDYAYEVLGLARHSEDKSTYVMYRPLYENSWFEGVEASVRPLAMFMENIEKDGKAMPRFARITDPAVISQLEAIKEQMYGS